MSRNIEPDIIRFDTVEKLDNHTLRITDHQGSFTIAEDVVELHPADHVVLIPGWYPWSYEHEPRNPRSRQEAAETPEQR